MSCLIMDYEPLCKLSTWIASLAENGYIYYGFDMPEALRISLRAFGGDLKPESIYNRLYAMNASAYAERYEEPDTPREPFQPFKAICAYMPPEYNTITVDGCNIVRHKPQKWHYKMAKRLDFFLYQCDEGRVRYDTLFSALRELSDLLKMFIVQNSPDYISAKWGD